VNEKSRIMLISYKSRNNDNRGEMLKPSTRGLFEAIERTAETTNMALRNKVARRLVHVELLINSPPRKTFFTSS
jgi:hypothetical protein